MDFAKLGGQVFRGDAITDFPSGGVVGLAEGKYGKTPATKLWMGQHAGMGFAVENDVFIDLVAHYITIMAPNYFCQLVEVVTREDGAGRVVR